MILLVANASYALERDWVRYKYRKMFSYEVCTKPDKRLYNSDIYAVDNMLSLFGTKYNFSISLLLVNTLNDYFLEALKGQIDFTRTLYIENI